MILKKSLFILITFLFIILPNFINCWKSFEPDLFDLVEDVGKNFYEVFEISQNADSNEIRKAYRKLSLQWHPDRNSDPNAETMFRRIVGINEVLKDEEKRKRYDEILENGLPDWKQPIYYYRRVRKLNFLEILATLAVVIVIGHYFVMWAQYFEQKLCLDERLSETRKKIEKKQKKKNKNFDMDEVDKNLQEIYDLLPAPSFKKTLPIRLVMWLYTNKLFIPKLIELIKSKKENKKDDSENMDDNSTTEEENIKTAEAEAKRRRLVNDLNPKKIEKSNLSTPVVPYQANVLNDNDANSNDDIDDEKNSKIWSDSKKSLLIKAISKYPGGTSDRWEKISKFVGKSTQQCIEMDKKLRSNYHASSSLNKTIGTALNDNQQISDDIISKRESDNDNDLDNDLDKKSTQWSQEQQKQLENALKIIDKNEVDRWEKIAEMIPGKTKDECIQRFKTLCQAVNKNKTKS